MGLESTPQVGDLPNCAVKYKRQDSFVPPAFLEGYNL